MSNSDRMGIRPIFASRFFVRVATLSIALFAGAGFLLPSGALGQVEGGKNPNHKTASSSLVKSNKTICAAPGNQALVSVTVKAVNIHLEVELDDNRRLKLRGLYPVRGTKDWPELAETARQALGGFVTGAQAWAQIAKGPADRWGRHLARLWVMSADNKRLPVVPEMIGSGWALANPMTADPACAGLLYKVEAAARAAKLGLWSDPYFKIFDPSDLAGLKDRAGQFVAIAGKVRDVRRWKSLTFFNFDRRFTRSLSIMLTKRARRTFKKAKMPVTGYAGKQLRVRGILEISGGKSARPRLRIPAPHFIEILQ